MSYQSIIEFLNSLGKIYLVSSKNKKTQLLDDAVSVTGLHRKSITRLLGQQKLLVNNKKNCGSKIKYPRDQLLPHIEHLWQSMERISSKRMKAAFSDWLPFYHKNSVTNQDKYLLQKMSVSTLGRFLKLIKKSPAGLKGLSSTCPARHMLNKVPINTLDVTVTCPGYVQSDTVAHCGDSLLGNFMNSVTLTDIFSTWTVNRALFTKKAAEVKEGLSDIRRSLPFEILAINTDSGSEFLNTPVVNLWQEHKIKFSRSRAYKKNDNCFVEQKNFTHVRELFGYQRIEASHLKTLMNDIYINCWNPLQNFFLPTFKLKEKIRIGARIKKVYDKPQTPYQRLMDSNRLTEEAMTRLSDQKRSLNPFHLKENLEAKLGSFFKELGKYNEEKKKNEKNKISGESS